MGLNGYNPDFVIVDEVSKLIEADMWNVLAYDLKA
jgi:hypothetical protein